MNSGNNRETLFDDEELDRILEEGDVESNINRTEFNEEELEAVKKPRRRKKIKARKKGGKLGKLIVIIIVCLLLIAAAVYFIGNLTGNRRKTSFETYNKTLETVGNGKIDVLFYLAEIEDDFHEFEEDPNYVYIKLYYVIFNTTGHDLSWENMPYVSVCKYTCENGTYNLIENSEQEFDLNALKSFGLYTGLDFSDIKEPLVPNRIPPRYGADIVKIPKSEWDINSYFVTIDNIDAIIKINDPAQNAHLKLFIDESDQAAQDAQSDSDTDGE